MSKRDIRPEQFWHSYYVNIGVIAVKDASIVIWSVDEIDRIVGNIESRVVF